MRAVPLILGLALVAAGPVRAHPPSGPLADRELAAARGGVQTPFGYDIGFGATVRTYVDGSLALETRLTWTDGGVVVARTSPVAEGADWGGILPSIGGGETRILHDLSGERIASVVVNTASGRTVRQQTDIVLVLPQLSELQARAAASRTGEALQQATAGALVDAAR